MARKKESGENLSVLKAKVQEGRIVIGTERVLKELRKGNLQEVFLAKNCPLRTVEDVQHYAQLAKVPVRHLELSNEELGILCKKNYFISVLATVGE